jgi:hypothetical protein
MLERVEKNFKFSQRDAVIILAILSVIFSRWKRKKCRSHVRSLIFFIIRTYFEVILYLRGKARSVVAVHSLKTYVQNDFVDTVVWTQGECHRNWWCEEMRKHIRFAEVVEKKERKKERNQQIDSCSSP